MGLNKSKNITSAKRTADKWFSIYIRLRDSDSNGLSKCITCDTTKEWREMDCGHFMSRRFLSVRYDKRNANAQCQSCNQFGAGEQYRHGKAIDLKFGKGTADELNKLSRKITKLSKVEIMEVAQEYKQMAEEIAEIKGLCI
jgi:hypothetical protein